MSTRPLIGLTGRRKKGDQIVGNFETLADLDIDVYYADYARGILEAGGLPVHLPLDIDPGDVVDRLDGVLLSGGADIGPEHYGAVAETDLYPPEAGRDTFELELAGLAADRATPILGICRGLQLINVHAGGTLHQHVPSHAVFDEDPATESHEVLLSPDSTLRSLYGTAERSVNSLHHQTIDTLGDDLRATAHAPDGTIEGIEHERLPIVAVQWHPEMMTGRSRDPIFGWIVDAARSRRR